MGATVVDESRGDIAKVLGAAAFEEAIAKPSQQVIKALQESLDECGYKKGSE